MGSREIIRRARNAFREMTQDSEIGVGDRLYRSVMEGDVRLLECASVLFLVSGCDIVILTYMLDRNYHYLSEVELLC